MPISRLFSTAASAADAVAGLAKAGFGDNRVAVVSKTGDHVSTDHIVRQGIAPARARHYAKRVQAGDTLVVVDAPFGYAGRATAILQSAGGGDGVTAPDTTYEGATWDEAAPLSSALGISTLSHNPTPFSSFWNIPTLSRQQAGKDRSHGLPTLSGNAAPLSSAIGLATLSDNPAPLSSAVGLATLSQNAAPLSSALGLAALSGKAAPLSAALGLPVLSHNPAPLSSAVHAPVLTEDARAE